MTKINQKVQKLFNIDIKSIDEEKRQVTFCFSDDSIDRMGEKVDQASWDVKSYKSNPVFLWGHNPEDPENVLGQGVSLDLNQNGKSYVTAQFDDFETNPKADLTFRQVVKRTLRAVSAGFIPHTIEFEDDIPVLKDNELLEISLVAIPANRNAIALSYKAGDLSKKDAQFLMKSMREEADAIEEQMNKSNEGVTKDMSDEQFAQLMGAVGAVSDKVNALEETVAPLVAAAKTADEEGTETEEEKTAREAQEAEDAAKAAKDGEIDQSGAGDDDIDLDAELTDELEAQIEAELAEAAA